MPITICTHFQAGGTGKSTATINISAHLALKFRVLVIDLDGAQGTTTNALMKHASQSTVYEFLRGDVPLRDSIAQVSDRFPSTLKILAGSPKLTTLESEAAIDRNYWLADRIEGLADFDFILIDTPPAAGAVTLMALTAATQVITPIATEPKCIEQLPAWGYLFEAVTKRLNPKLNWLGIIPSRHDGNTRLGDECLADLNSKFPDIVLPPVRSTVRLREAMALGLPPWRTPSTDYLNVTNQIIRRLGYDQNQEISENDCFAASRTRS